MDRKFLLTAFGYAILGLALGIVMAASRNHGQTVTHAHIMLLGFVVSFTYAVAYRLWLPADTGRLGAAQYWLHQLGTLGLLIGLFLLYGGVVPLDTIDPLLAGSSIVVLVALILMKILLIRAPREA